MIGKKRFEEVRTVKRKKFSERMAKAVVHIVEAELKTSANSTSCTIAYQPKAPKGLDRYRR